MGHLASFVLFVFSLLPILASADTLPFQLKRLEATLSGPSGEELQGVDYLSIDSKGNLLITAWNFTVQRNQTFFVSNGGTSTPRLLALPAELDGPNSYAFAGQLFEYGGAAVQVSSPEHGFSLVYYDPTFAPTLVPLAATSFFFINSQNGNDVAAAVGPEGGPLAHSILTSLGVLSPLALPPGNWGLVFSSPLRVAVFNALDGSHSALILDLKTGATSQFTAPGDVLSLDGNARGWLHSGNTLSHFTVSGSSVSISRSTNLKHGVSQPLEAMADGRGGTFFTAYGARTVVGYFTRSQRLIYPSCMVPATRRPFTNDWLLAARGDYALIKNQPESGSQTIDRLKWKKGKHDMSNDYCTDMVFTPSPVCGFQTPDASQGSGYLIAPHGGISCGAEIALLADKKVRGSVKKPQLQITVMDTFDKIVKQTTHAMKWGKSSTLPIEIAYGRTVIEGPINARSKLHKARYYILVPQPAP